MTLIIGANLSDRVYMASDTLVTNIDIEGNKTRGIDTQLKIEEVGTHVVVACSGNGVLGAFLVKKIQQNFRKLGIRELQSQIKVPLKTYMEEFFLGGASTRNCRLTLTFGGVDLTQKKKIDFQTYSSLLKKFNEQKKKSLYDKFGGKDLHYLTPQELLELRRHMENSQSIMKDVIFEAVTTGQMENGNLVLSIPDNHVFKLIIDPLALDPIQIDNYDYGQWAVSGAVEHKEIPEELMVELDFSVGKGVFEQDALNLAISVVNKFSSNIGGCVTIFMINQEGVFVTTHTLPKWNKDGTNMQKVYETTVSGGQLHKVTKGGLLIPFRKLTGDNGGDNFEL